MRPRRLGTNLNELLDKCHDSGRPDREEILHLLSLTKPSDVEALSACADAVRKEYCGSEVHLRGLVEFSNVCARHCNYCGLRKPNRELTRYSMSPKQIVDTAIGVWNSGLKTVVLQSGESTSYTAEAIRDIVAEIKQATGLAITLSVGERPYEDYKLWREAGADRYLLRHETANRNHYRFMHPDSRFEGRMRCLVWLRELGYQVGAGCMVGSPGQTIECLADDIEFLRDFRPDMAGIGPFIAHPQTPFHDYPSGTLDMSLRMVALARIVTRDALMPATTAMGTIHPDGLELALQSGADVMMPNCTPKEQREHYTIYPKKHDILLTTDALATINGYRARVEAVGRAVSDGYGHSRRMDPQRAANP